MTTLILAVGNRQRRDDGVAHHVLDLLPAAPDVQTRALFQLTPELAPEIVGFDVILFMDADVSATRVSLELLEPSTAQASALTHVARPDEVVALSRALFGFAGRAYLCRIPVYDLSGGEGLSQQAAEACEHALGLIAEWTGQMLNTGHGDSRTIG